MSKSAYFSISRLIALTAVALFSLLGSGCGSRHTGDFGGGGGGKPTVYVKSNSIEIIAKTGSSWDTHKGKIESVTESADKKSVSITGVLVYGRGESSASRDAGLTGSANESFYSTPFSATVYPDEKKIHIKAELVYAGSRYAFDEVLPRQ